MPTPFDPFDNPEEGSGRSEPTVPSPARVEEPALVEEIDTIDERPAVLAERHIPPITGGTLALTSDAAVAVAADPARDRVSIVALGSGRVRHVSLQRGDEPGRVAIDANDERAHVALRRGGAIATVDLSSAELVARQPVCPAPRGVAHEATRDLLHVVCAGGEVMTLDPASGEATLETRLREDLRDVVVRPDGLMVTRFKSAEVLRLDASYAVIERMTPPTKLRQQEAVDPFTGDMLEPAPLEPAVAWRTLAMPGGGVLMLHQRANAGTIELDTGDSAQADAGVGDGDPAVPGPPTGPGSNAYGSGACGSLVRSTMTRWDGEGRSLVTKDFPHSVLTVDAAAKPNGKWIAFVKAGGNDRAPRSALLSLVSSEQFAPSGAHEDDCHIFMQEIALDQADSAAQATAVAWGANSTLVVQLREPAELVHITAPILNPTTRTIALGGESIEDTGHDLYHRDTGNSIACVSCHVEGGEDGRVWHFDTLGKRRTQASHVGLEGTEPFHWDGDMRDLDMLVSEVFVHRMGGARQSPERVDALRRWLFALEPPPSIEDAESARAQRGKEIFEDAEVGCTNCHTGPSLTDNRAYDVGTGEPGHLFQVPSLRGIGYRAPFLHSGCATTLRERFDPTCGGGDQHGRTSHLRGDQIDDLVAYLRTL